MYSESQGLIRVSRYGVASAKAPPSCAAPSESMVFATRPPRTGRFAVIAPPDDGSPEMSESIRCKILMRVRWG